MARTYHLEASLGIDLPTNNAILGESFMVSGTVSCDRYYEEGEDGDAHDDGQANETIKFVRIRLGSAGPFTATPTGPAATPWISWEFTASNAPNGPLTITVDAYAYQASPLASGTSSGSRIVIIDATPPT